MPCFHPKNAWTTPGGAIFFAAPPVNHWAKNITTQIQIPCYNCRGCLKAHAQAWALRCRLELQRHEAASFTTLTYAEKYKPPTLSKQHLSLYIKRLRAAILRSWKREEHTNDEQPPQIKFFASGEYGEHRRRPHYHLLLYSILPSAKEIQECWKYGFTESDIVTTERVSYCAGYTDKKADQRYRAALPHDAISSDGEPYRYQPPFIQMSRNPGIGAYARDNYTQSWQLYAIKDGHKMTVPRYLKQGWKYTATDEEIANNKAALLKHALTRNTTYEQLEAAEKIAEAQHNITSSKRPY